MKSKGYILETLRNRKHLIEKQMETLHLVHTVMCTHVDFEGNVLGFSSVWRNSEAEATYNQLEEMLQQLQKEIDNEERKSTG